MNYISKGGRFYKKDDLKKIYSITEKDFLRLEPYITIPSSFSNSFAGEVSNAPRYEEKPTTPKIATININQADTSAFKALRGIRSVLALCIVKFRDALGGFHTN